jgi:hypothetical protein
MLFVLTASTLDAAGPRPSASMTVRAASAAPCVLAANIDLGDAMLL